METTHAILPLGPMARRLRVTTAWLKSEAEAGRIPCLRAGGRLLFAPDAVERVVAQRAADLSDRFEVVIDHDAEPSDTIDALAEFLLAVVEKRRSRQAIITTATAGAISPATVEI